MTPDSARVLKKEQVLHFVADDGTEAEYQLHYSNHHPEGSFSHMLHARSGRTWRGPATFMTRETAHRWHLAVDCPLARVTMVAVGEQGELF